MPGSVRTRCSSRGAGWLALSLAVVGALSPLGGPVSSLAVGAAFAEGPGRDPDLPSLSLPRGRGAFVPEAVATDAFGRVFALDRASARIVRLDPDGPPLSFGVADQGSDRTPVLTGIYARRGPDLYAIDDVAGMLYRFDLDGRLRGSTSYAEGLRDAGLAAGRAADFALGTSGELYLLDRIGARLLLFDRDGRFVTDLFAGLAGAARPRTPVRLAVADDGSLFVLDAAGCRVRRFRREGGPAGDWAGVDSSAISAEAPGLLAVTDGGRVVLVSRGEGRIWVRDREGRLLFEDALEPRPATPLSDLEAMGDSLLLLAYPGGGEILRRRLEIPEDGDPPPPR